MHEGSGAAAAKLRWPRVGWRIVAGLRELFGSRVRRSMAPSRRASVYVHFPYCLEKCPYCDFLSYKTPRESIDHAAYADAVLRELDARGSLEGRTVASVFFGGGTPSLWEPRELGRVARAVRDRFTVAGDLEVTVECNPTSLDGGRAAALAEAGVNRLSIGVQSLRDEELRFLGRLHDARGGLDAVRAALASPIGQGSGRVSADLIFGLPDQPPGEGARQAAALADLGLRHLSCYQLTIEPRTRFGELAKRGRLPLADDGAVADAFLEVHEVLAARGLRHYEISNYAVPGEEARHNLGYWRGEEYLGVGCGAFGRVGGVRWRNEIQPDRYMQNASDPTREREELDAGALLRERIMLGLRVAEGVDLAAAGEELGVDPWTPERRRTIDALAARGRLVVEGTRLRIPPDAWLFADDTAARLM
jgi:putative oxygen-independent coproporphyrinogen III oxidase